MKQQCIIAAKKLWNHPTLCVELSTGGFKRERDDSIMIMQNGTVTTTITVMVMVTVALMAVMVTMIGRIMVTMAMVMFMIHTMPWCSALGPLQACNVGIYSV